MNRFDKPVQYDYSFERYMPQFYTPNMELWAGVLDQKQKEEDLMAELTKKRPQHIETKEFTVMDENTGNWKTVKFGDTPMAQYYDQKIADIQKGLEEAALAGDKNLYNQRMKEAQRTIDTEWKPGGTAYWLQGRYDKLQKEKAKLAEQAAKDGEWGSSNMPFAEYKLYEESVGTYETPEQARPVGDVNIYPFVNVLDRLKDYALKVGVDQETVGKVNIKTDSSGILKITEMFKGVDPEKVKLLEAFVNQPNFKNQLRIERFGQAQMYTPELLQQEMKFENERIGYLREQNDFLHGIIDKLSKGEGVPEKDRQKAFDILKAKGMASAEGVDLMRGDNLYNMLTNWQKTFDPSKYSDIQDPGELLRKKQRKEKVEIAKGVWGVERSIQEEYDALYMYRKQHEGDVELKKLEIHSAKHDPIIGEYGDVKYDGAMIASNRNNAFGVFEDRRKNVQTILSNANVTIPAGMTSETASQKIIELYNRSNGDWNKFAVEMKQNGFNPDNKLNYNNLWPHLTGDGNFQKAADQLQQASVSFRDSDMNFRYSVADYVSGLSDDVIEYYFGKGTKKEAIIYQLRQEDFNNVDPKVYKDAQTLANSEGFKKQETIIGKAYEYVPPTKEGEDFDNRVTEKLLQIQNMVNADPDQLNTYNEIAELYEYKTKDGKFLSAAGIKNVEIGKVVRLNEDSRLAVAIKLTDKEGNYATETVRIEDLKGDVYREVVAALNQDYTQGNEVREAPATEGQTFFVGLANFSYHLPTQAKTPRAAEIEIEKRKNPQTFQNLQTIPLTINGDRYRFHIEGAKLGNDFVYKLKKDVGRNLGGWAEVENSTFENIQDIYSTLGLLTINPNRFQIVKFNPKTRTRTYNFQKN